MAWGLAAACLLAALIWWKSDRQPQREPIAKAVPTATSNDASQTPTLLAYQRALSRSPAQLEALLDDSAAIAGQSQADAVQICAFTRSDALIHALLGED